MSKLSQPKAPNIFEGKCSFKELLMQLTVFSSKIIDCLPIKENREITFNTESWIKIISHMRSHGERVRVFNVVNSLERS